MTKKQGMNRNEEEGGEKLGMWKGEDVEFDAYYMWQF